jgi:nitrite reductase (NADH) small subunit
MPYVRAADAASLAPDSVTEAYVNGTAYAICNIGGELRAYDGVCPHAGGPLGEGNVVDGNLVCPWHAWEYDARTGVNTFDDSCVLASFPVKVEGGDILIDVPA